MGKPIYLKVEKTLHHPLGKVWETVALRFGHVSDYNPEIKSSRYESEQRTGIGTKRHCDFPQKGYIKEEITAWTEMETFTLKFTESSVPLALLQSKFSFEREGDGTTLKQEFWYRMKAPMGWLSGLMKGRMRKTLENGLIGLENHLNK